MGAFHPHITPALKTFIEKQHIFFVATAPLSEHGHVNLSPKGLGNFQVISETQVAYMDLISSGNETSAHTLENGRITVMFCSFEWAPMILKLYGKGRAILPWGADWDKYAHLFERNIGERQIIFADIELVQTSCGFWVPLFAYQSERTRYSEWAEKKGPDGLQEYIDKYNLKSIDGIPTDLGLTRIWDES